MKPAESIAPVLEEKTIEQETPHIMYDDWDHSPSSLELEEMKVGSGGLRVALITALIFIVLVFCIILI